MFNANMTGKSFSDFAFPECGQHFDHLCGRIFESHKPVYIDSKFCFPDRSFMASEKSAYPFLGKDGSIDRILVLQTFDRTNTDQERVAGPMMPCALDHAIYDLTVDAKSVAIKALNRADHFDL